MKALITGFFRLRILKQSIISSARTCITCYFCCDSQTSWIFLFWHRLHLPFLESEPFFWFLENREEGPTTKPIFPRADVHWMPAVFTYSDQAQRGTGEKALLASGWLGHTWTPGRRVSQGWLIRIPRRADQAHSGG